MSLRDLNKTTRNGQIINNEKKQRTSEDTNISKKNATKRFQKENEEKKKTIDWEEEKDILKQFLNKEYPLSPQKINKIIDEKNEKYINIERYKSFFLSVNQNI